MSKSKKSELRFFFRKQALTAIRNAYDANGPRNNKSVSHKIITTFLSYLFLGSSNRGNWVYIRRLLEYNLCIDFSRISSGELSFAFFTADSLFPEEICFRVKKNGGIIGRASAHTDEFPAKFMETVLVEDGSRKTLTTIKGFLTSLPESSRIHYRIHNKLGFPKVIRGDKQHLFQESSNKCIGQTAVLILLWPLFISFPTPNSLHLHINTNKNGLTESTVITSSFYKVSNGKRGLVDMKLVFAQGLSVDIRNKDKVWVKKWDFLDENGYSTVSEIAKWIDTGITYVIKEDKEKQVEDEPVKDTSPEPEINLKTHFKNGRPRIQKHEIPWILKMMKAGYSQQQIADMAGKGWKQIDVSDALRKNGTPWKSHNSKHPQMTEAIASKAVYAEQRRKEKESIENMLQNMTAFQKVEEIWNGLNATIGGIPSHIGRRLLLLGTLLPGRLSGGTPVCDDSKGLDPDKPLSINIGDDANEIWIVLYPQEIHVYGENIDPMSAATDSVDELRLLKNRLNEIFA